MNLSKLQSITWYEALTLKERIASLHETQAKQPSTKVNTDLAKRRLQRWRSQTPFTKSSYFEQRLAMDGISEDEFQHLLGEPIEAVRDRLPAPPTWLTEIEEAYSRPIALDVISLSEAQDNKTVGFLNVIEPLISQGRAQVQAGIKALQTKHNNLPFDPTTVEAILLGNLPERLLGRLSRTMALELNVARLQGLLDGDTSEARFESFLQRLSQRDTAIKLLQEYPVLVRQIKSTIDQWVAFSLEFLQHLCTDWEAICAEFSPESNPGILVQIHDSLGDRHRGGRSVLIAEFSAGLQIVYKPKSLGVDVHFQELLVWINQRSGLPPFRTLKILNRFSYGWIEFIAYQSCNSVEEIQRFYQRQGGYLALLYAIEATDFHSENLIAAGEHSVLVDLESLFHPRPKQNDITETDQIDAVYTMGYSVLRVGLLPERLWSDQEYEGIDVSGLGGKEGQLSPDRLPYWERLGTDEMQLKRDRIALSGDQNRPTLNGTEVNVLDYTDALIHGFTKIYQLLLKHQDELLSESGPLARFAEDEVRIIVRPTRVYARLLLESFHPDLLRNGLDRDRFLDRLWVPIEESSYLTKVIQAEQRDLQQGDIPMFTTRPNSLDLWTSTNEQITDFFAESGLSLVEHRLQQLSDQDLARQLWFIRASLTSLSPGVVQNQWKTYAPSAEPEKTIDRDQLCSAAQAIGDRLEALALRSEDSVTWLGLMLKQERFWSLSPVGIDLYDGLPGIALFLAHLGSITQEPRYTLLAKSTLTTVQRQIERRKPFITWLGGFNGWGGVIYALTHLAAVWDDPSLLAEAKAIVELIPPLIEKDEQIDVASGAAGCICGLISLYHCVPSEQILSVAAQCGEHLIAHAQPMAQGIGWVVPDVGKTPLTGISHGAAGIALALLKLAELTHQEHFKTAALQAIAYERSVFSPEAGNWPDLRELEILGSLSNNGQNNFMTAWCHGAPGIGIARLSTISYLDNSEIWAEIDTALQTTLTRGFGSNHSLCHGDLGNLELLLQASQILNDPQWHFHINRLASLILTSIDQHGWLSGNPLGVESPGLMTGLAGIGYGLLRLADPERVPSVLVLEPPKVNNIKTDI